MLTNFIGTIPILVLLIVTDLAIIKQDGICIFKQKSFKMLTVFYLIVVVYGLLDHGVLATGKLKPQIVSFILIYSVFIISSHIKYLNKNQIKSLLIVSLFAFTLCVSISVFVATINPMAIRLSFRELEGAEELEVSAYRSMGVMSYALAHAISVISVGVTILFCYAKNKYIRIITFCLWLTMMKLQFDMTITTALLISILCSFLVVLNRFAKGKILITSVIFILAVFLFFSTDIATDFLGFAESSNTRIFQKFDDLFLSLKTGTGQGQMDYRNELYSTSLNTFLSNPIFGWGIDNGSRRIIGEHSFFLDYLAYYGMFALLYFGAWWSHYKSVLINNGDKFKQLCLYAFLPVCMLVVVKAPSVCTSMPFASLIFLQIIIRYLKNAKIENV